MSDGEERHAPDMAGNLGTRPVWDEAQAAKLVGATVLIGITRRPRSTGEDREEMFGIVQSSDPRTGFEVRLGGARTGEVYWLPPDLRNFFSAPAGEYHLRSTGETVINPDYISNWTIESPTD